MPDLRNVAGSILTMTTRPALVMLAGGDWIANEAFAQEVLGGDLAAFTALSGADVWGDDWPEVAPLAARILAGEEAHGQHDLMREQLVAGRIQRSCHNCSFARLLGDMPGVHVVCLDSTAQLNARTRLALQQDLYEAMAVAGEPREAMLKVAEAIGRRWDVAGVGFAEADARGASLTVTTEWSAGPGPGFGGVYQLDDLGEAGALLRQGEPLAIEDIDEDPSVPAYLKGVLARGLARSVLAVTLLQRGRMVASLFLTDGRPRRWSPEDISLAQDALQRTRELLVRLEAESEAMAAKERLDLIESDGSLGLFDWDVVTDSEYRSAGLGRLLGLETEPAGRVERGGLARVLHPADLPVMQAAVAAALKDGQKFVHEYRILRPDGTLRWLMTEAQIVRAVDGTPLRMTGIVRDVTARVAFAEADAAAERRRQFVAALSDRLRLPADPLAQMAAAAQTLAEHFRVAQVGFSEVRDGGVITFRRDLVNPPLTQRVAFPIEGYGAEVAAALRRGELVAISDVGTDPRTQEVAASYRRLGVGAIVSVPVLKGGRLVATFDVNDPEPHAWTMEELAACEIVAERTAAAAERASAEEALKENERLLRAIGDASTDLIYAKDREGRLLYANPATLAVIGLEADAATGAHQSDFTADPGEAEATSANDRLVIATGDVHSFEERYTTPEGELKIYASTKAPLRDPEGRIIGLAGVSHDVTGLRRAEAALIESEARFRTLAENIPILCWMAHADGHIFWYNSRWYEFTGTTLAEMQGWGWERVHDPAVLPEVRRRWGAALAAGTPFDMVFPLRAADGHYHNFLTKVAPIRNESGEVVRWFGTNTDVTELEALRRTEALHDLVLESATDVAILTNDLEGRVTSWNRGAELLFGRPAAEMLGELLDPLFPEAAAARTEAASHGRAEYEGRVVRPDGSSLWASGVKMPLKDPGGMQIGFLAILRDRSEERRQEEHRQLLVEELNHRVKNTLAIVQGMAHQSFRHEADMLPSRQLFEQRLAALAAAHALLTRESWEAADVRDIVSDMLRTHDPEGGRIRVEGPSARLDPQTSVTLAMMLHELVTNARKYGALSGEGGEVEVLWQPDPLQPGAVVLDWIERGGPPVREPATRGFGSRLIERAFPAGDGNSARLRFDPEGVRCRIVLRDRRRGPEPGRGAGA